MNKLQLPHAKLFYVVGEAYRKRLIDESEKRMLKEKIINDNVEVFEILDQNDNENSLVEQLINLIRAPEPEIETEAPAVGGEAIPNPNQQEEASSPWGEFLRRKKRNIQDKNNDVKDIKDLIKPKKAEETRGAREIKLGS